MTTRIELDTRGGGKAIGILAVPQRETPAPCMVVIHEWWGLNDDIASIVQRFADEGFLALAPDLYGGKVTDNAEQAFELANALQTPAAMNIVAGAVAYLQSHGKSNGKVGVTGFCLGGAMTLAASCNVEGLSAILPFYGIPMAEYTDWSRLKAPIQGHFAADDMFVPAEKARAVKAAVEAAGGVMDLFVYDAGHAFMRAGDPAAYHEESAKKAWERALSFLRERLEVRS